MSDPASAGRGPKVGRDKTFDAAMAGAAAIVGLLALVLGLGVGRPGPVPQHRQHRPGHRPPPRRPGRACGRRRSSQGNAWHTGWLLVAASCATWAVGQMIWTWFETIQGIVTPFPSAADVFFLLAVPLAVAGMLYFPSSPGTQTGRARALLDGLIVATSVLWISWVTVLGPTLHDGGGTRLERAIGLAYPAGDAVLITILIIAFVRCDPAGRVATGVRRRRLRLPSPSPTACSPTRPCGTTPSRRSRTRPGSPATCSSPSGPCTPPATLPCTPARSTSIAIAAAWPC